MEVKFKHFVYPVLILPNQVKEMREITELDDAMKIGASITLVEMEDAFRNQMNIKPEHKTRIFKGAVEILHLFAGKQIRNVAVSIFV